MPERRIILGIAGKCCAGKDTVANYFIERGFQDINVDRVGHLGLEFHRDTVAARFGQGVIRDDGSVDRAALGAIVFADDGERRALEAILHPWMVEQVGLAVEEIRGSDDPAVRGAVINAALLFPMGLDRLCDRILWTTAPLLSRIRRARRRDELSALQVVRRIISQRRLQPQDMGSHADMITVKNSGTRTDLFERLDAVYSRFFPAGD